ncbi:MAG: hypothetical protein ABMA64_31450, partial [Myxococcota bacterium]
ARYRPGMEHLSRFLGLLRRMWASPWRNRALAGVTVSAAASAVVIGVAWLLLHTLVRTWFWDRVAARPLSDSERADLARCEPVAWWTWLKVVESGVETPCGEAWLATSLAARVGSDDRAGWLVDRAARLDGDPSTRMRVATALSLAGHPPPVEPAWLVDELDPMHVSSWVRAAAESDVVAAQLGARLAAFGAVAKVHEGALPAGDGLPALEWLASVDDARAEQLALTAALEISGGDPTLPERVRSRRAAGRPVSGMGARWSRVLLAHPECGPSCAAMWTEIADQVLTDDALESGLRRAPDPIEPAPLAEWMMATGRSVEERRAAAWAFQALVRWIEAGPDRASRLRTFAARPVEAGGSLPRLLWDGVGPPFLDALVVTALGEATEVPVEVRVGDQSDVWMRIGDLDVVRSCGPEGGAPPGPAWPQGALISAALVEYAVPKVPSAPMGALPVVIAAQRFDPLVAGPLAVRLAGAAPAELEVGRRIGVGLLGPMTLPSGADAARRRTGELAGSTGPDGVAVGIGGCTL